MQDNESRGGAVSILASNISIVRNSTGPGTLPIEVIETAGFHSYGAIEYLDFYPADIGIPVTAVRQLITALTGANPSDTLILSGQSWAGSREQHAVTITSRLLENLAYILAMSEAIAASAAPAAQGDQRDAGRLILDKWATGKYPFQWQ